MLLHRYLLRCILGRLLLATPALVLLVLAFDLGDQGQRLARQLGWQPVLKAAVLHLPLITVQVLPVALVLSIALALGGLRQRGELRAMACAGLSPAAIAGVILAAGVLCWGGSHGLGELLVPPMEQRADQLYGHTRVSSLTGEQAAAGWLRVGPWFMIKTSSGNTLGLKVDRTFQLEQRLAGSELARAAPGPLSEARAIWARAGQRPEALSSLQLRSRLERLRRAGQRRPVEALVLHTKLAYPVVNLTAALLACALFLGGNRGRDASSSRDLAAAMGLILGLWFLIASGWLLGRSGWITPAPAVWGPVALMGVLGLLGLALRLRR